MQYKQVVNPSFLVFMLDMQDLLKDGWEIDPKNLPVHNLMFFEANLIKDDEDAVKDVFSEESPKKAGRPPRVKQ